MSVRSASWLPEAQAESTSCDFCRSISQGSTAPHWAVVAESEDFVAVPSIGALVPGWMLVVPKRHSLNLARLQPREATAMRRFTSDVVRDVVAEYGAVSLFEHGPSAAGRAAGCGIDHAHLHVVPTRGLDLLSAIRAEMPSLRWRPMSSDETLQSASCLADDYLFVVDEFGEKFLCTEGDIPSQAFRQVIAGALGRPAEYNWRSHPQKDIVYETILRSVGRELASQ